MANMFGNQLRIESRSGGCRSCAPCAQRGLQGLGEGNFLDSITGHIDNLWNNITGANANRRAQESALALQQVQAQRAVEEARSRAETLKTVVPWVAGGAIVLIGAVVAMKVIK